MVVPEQAGNSSVFYGSGSVTDPYQNGSVILDTSPTASATMAFIVFAIFSFMLMIFAMTMLIIIHYDPNPNDPQVQSLMFVIISSILSGWSVHALGKKTTSQRTIVPTTLSFKNPGPQPMPVV